MKIYMEVIKILIANILMAALLVFSWNANAKVFKKCEYIAQYPDGRSAGVMKSGKATKMSKACDEAKKRCDKKLKKLYKKGKLERGAVCYKYGGEVR